MEKFGRTLLLVLFLFFLFIALKMAIRIADPYTRRVSASLADTLISV